MALAFMAAKPTTVGTPFRRFVIGEALMSKRTLNLSDKLYDYILEVSLREHALLAELRAETNRMPEAGMQISPDQGQFMSLLARLIGAKRVIEIGTFTGYSALCFAQALPEDGLVVCCDVSEDFTAIGRRYWQRAGLAEKIELRLAPAGDTIDALLSEGAAGSFDLAFIDADKENYDRYFDGCLELLRPGGVILVDNVLWGGSVIDPAVDDTDTKAIRALNRKLTRHSEIELSLLPIGDGLTLARKL